MCYLAHCFAASAALRGLELSKDEYLSPRFISLRELAFDLSLFVKGFPLKISLEGLS